jgi:hypothetical protein
MSKVKEEVEGFKVSRRSEKLAEVLDHGLSGTIAYQGGELTGFSMKIGNVDFLITLRAYFPAGHRISWVGAASMVECILKAERLAAEGGLSWAKDKYRED